MPAPMNTGSMTQLPARNEALPVRALLVDDYALFRAGLRRALTALGICIVGEASTGRDAVRLAKQLRPDVVVMDPDMPATDGIETTRQIAALPDAPAVLVLADTQSADVLDALLAGARSFLFKDSDAADLAHAIRRAAVGEYALAPSVTRALVERLRALETQRARAAPKPCPVDFTGREKQVLMLIAKGRDNASIGSELFISASTAKQHVAAILAKLGASNRAQAAAEAVRFGLA